MKMYRRLLPLLGLTHEVWESMEALIIHPAGFHQATEESANGVQRVSHPTFKICYWGYSSVEKVCDRKEGGRVSMLAPQNNYKSKTD